MLGMRTGVVWRRIQWHVFGGGNVWPRTVLGIGLLWSLFGVGIVAADAPRLPNFVLVFTDDQGYADVGCFGGKQVRTPNLDRLAEAGMRFTDFYVAQPVCSASRAALLTGCYPNRIGILGALAPSHLIGISDQERTIAEVLKPHGYATAIYGKWHLGHHPRFLPTRHGFDDYFGLPYSNDMWPEHPTVKSFPPLPLIDKDQVVTVNPDQRTLTTSYTERAVEFIDRNRDRPFFLYVPHSMPHVPLFVSKRHEGATGAGLYADVLFEIDWSVGQIVEALRRNKLEDNTLVVFVTDNGPWLSYGNHAGSAAPLREGKGTTFEGGVRVPAIFYWPGTIPAGSVCREPAMTIDLLPTFAALAGIALDHVVDGKDISPLLRGEPSARSPHDALYFYWESGLEAVRAGKWKLHLPHRYRTLKNQAGTDGTPGPYTQEFIELALFDLEQDPGETKNLADSQPDVVEQLQRYVETAREDLGDSLTGRAGKNLRPPGRLEEKSAAKTSATDPSGRRPKGRS